MLFYIDYNTGMIKRFSPVSRDNADAVSQQLADGCNQLSKKHKCNYAIQLAYSIIDDYDDTVIWETSVFTDFNTIKKDLLCINPETQQEQFVVSIVKDFLGIEGACINYIKNLNLAGHIKINNYVFCAIPGEPVKYVMIKRIIIEKVKDNHNIYICYDLDRHSSRKVLVEHVYNTEVSALEARVRFGKITKKFVKQQIVQFRLRVTAAISSLEKIIIN